MGETETVPAEYMDQKQASFMFDEKMLTYLQDIAPTERDKQRLLRLAQDHASGWLTALPSNQDGSDTIMRPRNFTTSVAYRLGMPVLLQEIPCPHCKQTMDIYGDHATCCKKGGDLITRHNSIRDLCDRIATEALLSPVMEKKGLDDDPPTSSSRIGLVRTDSLLILQSHARCPRRT